MNDFRKDQKKKDEESLWEQLGRKEDKTSYDWSGFKKRILGEKTARDVAEEEAQKLKKK
jgi:hypothetical protein